MSQETHDKTADDASQNAAAPPPESGRRKPAIIAAVVAVLAVIAAGIWAVNHSGDESGSAATGSGTAAKHTYTFSGVNAEDKALIAESHIWDDAPYKPELVETSFPESVAGLNSGQLLLGYYGVTTALRQQSESQPQWTDATSPIKVVYGYRQAEPQFPIYPQSALIVRTDAGIQTPADLRGKTWASQVGGDQPTVYLTALRQSGLTRKDIKEISADSYGPLVAAFRSGDAQVLQASPSNVIDLLESGEARIFYTADELGIAVFRGLAARADTLQDPAKEAVIKDYLTRWTEFLQWKEAHPREHLNALVNVAQDDQSGAEFTVKQFKGVESIAFDDALITAAQKSADALHWGGDVPNAIEPANIRATFDGRFNEPTAAVPYLFRKFDNAKLPELLAQINAQPVQ